jgi:hypothetical protein
MLLLFNYRGLKEVKLVARKKYKNDLLPFLRLLSMYEKLKVTDNKPEEDFVVNCKMCYLCYLKR